MVYRRRYFSRARRYGGRARTYFRSRGGFGNKWITFGGGVAAGYLAPQVVPYQDELALVITAAPVKVPRMVRSVASGYVVGRIIRNIMGRGIGTGTGGNSPWL